MAKKTKSFSIPHNTMVELVGTNGKKSVKIELEYQKAISRKTELENETIIRKGQSKPTKKWNGWRFQIFQLGFSSHKTDK